MKLNIRELKEKCPDRFLSEWGEYSQSLGDDWWEYIWECFVEDCTKLGIEVTGHPAFDLYRYYVAFDCQIPVSKLMEQSDAHEKYYPLYLAVKVDRSYVGIRHVNRGHISTDTRDEVHAVPPQGVFADMPEDDWVEMLDEMWAAFDPEAEAREWVRDLGHDLLKALEKEYECLTSEEQFIEMCEANEVTFEVDEYEIQD